MSEDLEEWKEDWNENKESFESGQSELFKRIREGRSLEMKSIGRGSNGELRGIWKDFSVDEEEPDEAEGSLFQGI